MQHIRSDDFKAWRIRTGLTQAQLAERWQVSTNTISKYEMGRTPIRRIVQDAMETVEREIKRVK